MSRARDLSKRLNPAGHLLAEVSISSGPASDLEPYVTAISASPDAVAGFLEELAADIRRTASVRVVHYRWPAVCGSDDPGDLWSGDSSRVTCEACKAGAA